MLAVTISVASAAGVLEVRAPGYTWQNAEYSTSHVFIDEVAGTTADIEVGFDPQVFIDEGAGGKVEVFTNLNRRDLVTTDKNGDGEHDGILGVNGTTIENIPGHTDPVTGHYYIPHAMSYDVGEGRFKVTIPASKTGAYRMTARFKTTGAAAWTWYGLRDHAVVVSPVQARDIRMYELNVLNIEADGTAEGDRSTWEDLSDRAGALHTGLRDNDWSLDYVAELGVNWLWFQPYHPYGIDGRHLSAADINARAPGSGASTWLWNGGSPYEDVNYAYDLGSPYAVKNFWEIEPRTSANYNGLDSLADQRSKAMTSFVNFVSDADAAGIQIMPDAAFNHAAWDVEVGPPGVDLYSGGGWATTDEMRNRELRFFSRENDYYQRAGLGPGEAIAPGPDRYDFGKWLDVKDIFFGRYAALWRNGGSTDKQKDEGDWFDTSSHGFDDMAGNGGSFDAVTRNTWKYFAEYGPYWVATSRPAGEDRNSVPGDGDAATRYAWDGRGIDGLRCDFGQGLPPQCWEYIINRARSVKWSFVFMAESLDGGEVTYRSSRHFDILNENTVFGVKSATTQTDFSEIYEARRTAYGQGLVLLNTVSHDEDNYADPWVALSRYGAHAAIGGAPMLFAGQELGLAQFFGYDVMEKNFGKYIPHFKTHNSMMPLWADADFGNDQLFKVYAAMNQARARSGALKGSNRWFLGGNNSIFAVAKYEEEGVPTRLQDVVLAFANLDRDNDQSETYVIPASLGTRIGLEDARLYNVMNIAAYERPPAVVGRRDALLWGTPISGADLKATGFSVFMNEVPTSVGAWDTVPFEAQYLRLVDVTEPLEVEISSIGAVGSDVEVVCDAVEGRYYHLQRSATLQPGSWETVQANVKATGASVTLVDVAGAGEDRMFYRAGISYGAL